MYVVVYYIEKVNFYGFDTRSFIIKSVLIESSHYVGEWVTMLSKRGFGISCPKVFLVSRVFVPRP